MNNITQENIERRKKRVKQTAEIFTPNKLVNEMLDKLPKEVWEEGKTFCDPACGNGNFLIEVLARKIKRGHRNPLQTIYGVELMADNVEECKYRLLNILKENKIKVTKKHRETLDKNIVCHNALTYHFQFCD